MKSNSTKIREIFSLALGTVLILVMTANSYAHNYKTICGLEGDPFTIAKTIKGTVSTSAGPLPFANIYLKGTQTGLTADMDGNYEFPVKLNEGDVLVFSFLGYETLEYTIKEDTPAVLNITLEFTAIMVTGALEDKDQSGVSKWLAKLKAKL